MKILYTENFEEWRQQARSLLLEGVLPHEVEWESRQALQPSFFQEEKIINSNQTDLTIQINIPKAFLSLAQKVACHRDDKKWILLYTALWRITQGEKHLLDMATDPVIHKLFLMQKAVGRDAHKMQAFVRFKLYELEGESYYIAWHKPDHKIVKWVAPFFKRRFATMRWAILTPDDSVYWDGERLHFGEGVAAFQSHTIDPAENLWRTFYRAIFNPARIKLKAMRREMPVRYWPTLPETEMIPLMLHEAPQRVATMLQNAEGFYHQESPATTSLTELRSALKNCRTCELHKCAKQTVTGMGPVNAKMMLVGEQPGDKEDQLGMPFVGPAGEVLNQILAQIGLKREDIYLTNAVKHFKFVQRLDKRIHKSPTIPEINACKPWLEAEIKLVNPKIIVCLGLTAARALIGYGFTLKEKRGQYLSFSDTQKILITYHPSAVLRAVSKEQKTHIYECIIKDLKSASQLV